MLWVDAVAHTWIHLVCVSIISPQIGLGIYKWIECNNKFCPSTVLTKSVFDLSSSRDRTQRMSEWGRWRTHISLIAICRIVVQCVDLNGFGEALAWRKFVLNLNWFQPQKQPIRFALNFTMNKFTASAGELEFESLLICSEFFCNIRHSVVIHVCVCVCYGDVRTIYSLSAILPPPAFNMIIHFWIRSSACWMTRPSTHENCVFVVPKLFSNWFRWKSATPQSNSITTHSKMTHNMRHTSRPGRKGFCILYGRRNSVQNKFRLDETWAWAQTTHTHTRNYYKYLSCTMQFTTLTSISLWVARSTF